jgi:hypothetical protein
MTRVYRFSDDAQAVARILHATCVMPDAQVLDALRTIHKRNPTLSFRAFVSGVMLMREMREAATRGLSRVLRFDGDGSFLYNGFARRWSEYCLGEIRLDQTPVAPRISRLDEVIARARREIAREAGKPESAVKISIDF